MQVVEPTQAEQVGDLLDDLEGVGDAPDQNESQILSICPLVDPVDHSWSALARTLEVFFAEIGVEACARIRHAAIDMFEGYA